MRALIEKRSLTREVVKFPFFEGVKRMTEVKDKILEIFSVVFLAGAVICIILEIIHGGQQNLYYILDFIGGYLITTHFRLGDIKGDIRDLKRDISKILERLPP